MTMPDRDCLTHWRALRALTRAADWTLDEAGLAQAEALFLSCYAGLHTPEALTREYGREEFLLPLDAKGAPVRPHETALRQARNLMAAHRPFRRWFREDRLADGTPVLSAARWLCHLAGLRHATVEIFIDPPGLPGHTLVQVRGMDKFEAPGAFDMPCAGHVTAGDTFEASLSKELGEELALRLDDFDSLRELARYESCTDIEKDVTNVIWPVNIEYRSLFYARIKPAAINHIQFTDGEVAGLAVFTVEALRTLIHRFPERVASGLSGAMPFYPA